MRLVVWKFRLGLLPTQTIAIPAGVGGQPAKILHVTNQGDVPYLWALVDADLPLQERQFLTLGTGHPLPDDAVYVEHVGSYQLSDQDPKGGPFVGHVFEILG